MDHGRRQSLRDIDNHPRVTFRHVRPARRLPPHDHAGWMSGAAGHWGHETDQDPPRRRIIEWASSLPYAVDVNASNEALTEAVLPRPADSSFADAIAAIVAEHAPRRAAPNCRASSMAPWADRPPVLEG